MKFKKKLDLHLNEGSLSRAYGYFKRNIAGFVTAFKDKGWLEMNSRDALKANRDRNNALLMNIKSFGYNSYKVDGTYNSVSGRIDREESFCVQCPTYVSEEQFAKDMATLGKRYDQESVLIARPDGIAYLVYCKTGKKKPIGDTLHLSKYLEPDQGRSLVNGRPVLFTFKEDDKHYKERIEKFKKEHPEAIDKYPEIFTEELHVIDGDYSWHAKTAGEQFLNRDAGKGIYWD